MQDLLKMEIYVQPPKEVVGKISKDIKSLEARCNTKLGEIQNYTPCLHNAIRDVDGAEWLPKLKKKTYIANKFYRLLEVGDYWVNRDGEKTDIDSQFIIEGIKAYFNEYCWTKQGVDYYARPFWADGQVVYMVRPFALSIEYYAPSGWCGIAE